jgi:hypothetical protein
MYYKKADVSKRWFSSTFDIRFEEIRNTFISKGVCAAFWVLLKWRICY